MKIHQKKKGRNENLATVRSMRPWIPTREKKGKDIKKETFSCCTRFLISSEKFGVWDLCVHHVLNLCFFFLLFFDVDLYCLLLLFSHIITLCPPLFLALVVFMV